MKHELKILLIWISMIAGIRLLLFLPHREIESVALVNIILQLLLFVLSIDIARNSFHDQKYVFVNFSIFFGFVIVLFLGGFIGYAFFPNSTYNGMLYHIYVNKIGLSFLLLFVVLFLAVDNLLLRGSLWMKYAAAFASTSVIIGLFFQPFLLHPFKIYDVPEYMNLENLAVAKAELTNSLKRDPTDDELSQRYFSNYKSNPAQLEPITLADARKNVADLAPYLNPGGMSSIFWKPLEWISIYIRGVSLFVIIAILFSIYNFDRPVSAYVDKIVILLFLFCALDILHLYASMRSESLDVYDRIHAAGQYVTIANFFIMVYAFDLKRRFVRSVTGKYYEQAIQESPGRITRLRDEIDTYILKAFFNNRAQAASPSLFSTPNQPHEGETKS